MNYIITLKMLHTVMEKYALKAFFFPDVLRHRFVSLFVTCREMAVCSILVRVFSYTLPQFHDMSYDICKEYLIRLKSNYQ